MDPDTRACVAYIAGAVISGAFPHQLVDKGRNLRIQVKGTIKGGAVEVFDYERNCKIMGKLPKLFDFGTNTALELEISGKNFSGHSKHVEHPFAGMVEARKVKLHDYDEARDFYYELGD